MHPQPSQASIPAKQRVRADLALVLCSLLWGTTFVIVKNSLQHVSVFLFLAVRFTLAALLMAALRPRALLRLGRAELRAGIELGFFMFCGYAFQTAGLQFTTPAKSGFVTGSSVVLVPLLLGIFWGKRLTAWVYAGAIAAALGLYFLTVPVEGVAHLNRGDLLTFVAAAFYATHIILVGEYTREHGAAALSILQVVACALLAWSGTAFAHATRAEVVRFAFSWQLILGISLCAIFATAIAFSIQLWAQQYTTSSHAAIIFTLEPVFAVLTSYLVIGERLAARSIFGAALVLAGILVAELFGPPAAPESPEPVFAGRIYFEPWWWQ
jgi:drug/metabolite transporter (DMT)-like permease